MGVKQWIEVETQFEALHCWPECPYDDVAFLKNKHRHMVYVTVRISTDTDREIEFFMFKRSVDATIDNLFGSERLKDIGTRSMEIVANELLYILSSWYNKHGIIISVSEDNQVRAILEYTV